TRRLRVQALPGPPTGRGNWRYGNGSRSLIHRLSPTIAHCLLPIVYRPKKEPHMRDRLAAETKAALKSQDKPRLGALRLISAALQQADIAAKAPIPDKDIPALLQRMIKQRRESV